MGKDSHINEHVRHKTHYHLSRYNEQVINRVLQNHPQRYMYHVLNWNVESIERLNALEIQYIRQLRPRFNFTHGGDGVVGWEHTKATRNKLSHIKTQQNNATGLYRVSKKKCPQCNNTYTWQYQYRTENMRYSVSSTDLNVLKQKVLAAGLPWHVVNSERALQSFKENVHDR